MCIRKEACARLYIGSMYSIEGTSMVGTSEMGKEFRKQSVREE